MFKLLREYISARIFLWLIRKPKGYKMLEHMQMTIVHAIRYEFTWLQRD